jgi:hypothetical protein
LFFNLCSCLVFIIIFININKNKNKRHGLKNKKCFAQRGGAKEAFCVFSPASCSYFYYYNKNNNKNEARAKEIKKNKNAPFASKEEARGGRGQGIKIIIKTRHEQRIGKNNNKNCGAINVNKY